MLLMRQIVRQEARIAGRFRKAVPMVDGKMKPVFETHGCFFRQRSRTADESLETVELVGREIFICIEEEFKQSGNYAHTGHVFIMQPPPERCAFEFPV